MTLTSQQIQRLLEPPSTDLANKAALDLLNERYPEVGHLDGLDAAVQEAGVKSAELSQQLIASKDAINSLISKTQIAALTHLESARELASERQALADELATLSHELVSSLDTDGESKPTLLENIETMHRALKELESVRAYVSVIERALALSEAAVSQMRASPSPTTIASTSKYKTLQAFVEEVSSICGQVGNLGGGESSTLHLVTLLQQIQDKTWADMKGILSTSLIAALEKLNWPMLSDYPTVPANDRKAFETAFTNLLALQEMQVSSTLLPGESLHPSSPGPDFDGLFPLQTLVLPVAQRFKYHFDGSRETNRLDKPEWYLTHVINIAHDHRPFMEKVVQSILGNTKYKNISAWHNYTMLLLPLPARKLRRTIPQLLSHPGLLAHTVYQTLIFDSALREMGYEFQQSTGTEKKEEAKTDKGIERAGVSAVILDKKEWFDAWLEGEKKFAEDQYHEIISASDAWHIADDDLHDTDEHHSSRGIGDLRATNSARRVKALVEQVTDRYSPLPSFTQRTRFLIHVQLPVLESYHARVSSSLDAFETLSSALVRAVPGALGVDGPRMDSRRLTAGVDGSQRLCKALISARYVQVAMEGWGEEVFFLELWAEINHRASLRSRAEDHQSLPNPNDGAQVAEGTIFEELITQYTKLVFRAEDMLVQQVCGEIEALLKPHFVAVTSPKPDSESEIDSENIAVPPTLLPPIALLSSHLSFQRSTLPNSLTTALYRRIATRLAEHILQREILYRSGLTRNQLRTVHAECELWAETCQAALATSRARVEAPWSRLLAAGRLLDAEGPLSGGDGWEAGVEGVEAGGLGQEEVRTVLRLRDDCRR
ncbi:TIP-1 family-domain-containing protein [Hygrophoropsis aurantiaca]|uniref:TIP-1 family-domain-containing protein n=1 Tax=Hygrophoropsis aurantiaca TaxID=72124 RepID=A0ACB8AQD8_9AGAM|nr:TIP-1 family-domain-containing protein [Hygrophoropsis aurantiaca]